MMQKHEITPNNALKWTLVWNPDAPVVACIEIK